MRALLPLSGLALADAPAWNRVTGMTFALVQKTLEPIPRPAVQAAYAAVGLTGIDGLIAAKDAYGILVGNLAQDRAVALQQALAGQNVQTEVVDQADLPALPMSKGLKQAQCLPEALLVYDVVGRETRLAWSQVKILAAGSVGTVHVSRDDRWLSIPGPGHGRWGFQSPHSPERYIEITEAEMLLEVFVDADPGRYRVNSRGFNYAYLSERRRGRYEDNFVLLVRDLMRLATRAGANRGAVGLTQEPPRIFPYPNRRAFEDETIWLLWQGGRKGA